MIAQNANGAAGVRRHPLVGLIVSQALGAFNDNAWKQIVILLAIVAAASDGDGAGTGGVRPDRPDDPADARSRARRACSPTGSASDR